MVDPELFWRAIERDIAEGPDGPRARTGALQRDLARLHDPFAKPAPGGLAAEFDAEIAEWGAAA